jgi:hypothetical protein
MLSSFSSYDVKRTAGSYGSVKKRTGVVLRTVTGFLTIFIIITE